MTSRCLLASLVLVVATAWGGTARADDHQINSGPTIDAYFLAEAFGSYRVRSDGERVREDDIDLDTTLGGGLRLEHGFGMLAYGFSAEFRGYGNSDYDERDFAIDLNPVLGVRVPLIGRNGRGLILRGTLTGGYTLMLPNETYFGQDRFHGFNVGALAGLGYSFGRVGFFADLGVRHHRVFGSADFGVLGNAKGSIAWTQFSFNSGFRIAI